MNRNLKPRSKIWIERNGQYAFGGGLAEILAAIQKTGSIKEAARRLNESYRYVWGRIRKTEKILGIKLVETVVGGAGKQRTKLTQPSLIILPFYQIFEKDIQKKVNQECKKILKKLI
ncbi:MAG: LysR family transcriptional regulator [Planctomycetota bacterium]